MSAEFLTVSVPLRLPGLLARWDLWLVMHNACPGFFGNCGPGKVGEVALHHGKILVAVAGAQFPAWEPRAARGGRLVVAGPLECVSRTAVCLLWGVIEFVSPRVGAGCCWECVGSGGLVLSGSGSVEASYPRGHQALTKKEN